MAMVKIKATQGDTVIHGYLYEHVFNNPMGGVVIYDGPDDKNANGFSYMYEAERWKIERIIEIPTKPFAVIKVGGNLLVNLGDKRNDLLGQKDRDYAEFVWVRITDQAYGNSYSEEYVRDRINEGEPFEVIYHGEG